MSLTPSKAPASFVTPTKRAALVSGTEAGPSRARPQGASPAYSSRKHSLYGVEDRVVIDAGSRIWKVGFSGEPEPRAVFWASTEGQAWDVDLERIPGTRGDREEARRVVEMNILKKLRETFVKHLTTDAKSRKVIILEGTFMPTYIKDAIAQGLFDNLRVPSVSFTPSSLLALAACGRITGLVVDCGWLETTVTPVFHSRPLFHLARSTPLAGRALHERLKLLLRYHATYTPPGSQSIDATRPPPDVLTDRVVEKVLTEGCTVASSRATKPPTDAMDIDNNKERTIEGEEQLATDLKERYSSTDLPSRLFRIPHSAATRDGTVTLSSPGWILARAAEILFEQEADLESETVPDAILATLLKLPVDLRQTMISTILVVGGTASLPRFIPRLRDTIIDALQPKSFSQDTLSLAQWKKRNSEPYRELYGLLNKLTIINDPKPIDGRSGSAPRWTPGLMSWVGGSLAGALKTGAPEIIREDYDTQYSESVARGDNYRAALEDAGAEAEVAAAVGISVEELQPGMALLGTGRRRGWRDGVAVADWTRHASTTV